MSEIKQYICTSCPKGCHLEVTADNNRILNVSGNECGKGIDFAKNEYLSPKRVVTSTVLVLGGDKPVLPVKTAAPVPKAAIFDCMKKINHVTAVAPVNVGDVIIKDVLGTGIDVVSTGVVKKRV